MPELGEVAFYESVWAESLGETIRSVEANCESRVFRHVEVREWEDVLVDSSISSCDTHGKQMLFGFDGEVWLGVHLGMTGLLRREGLNYEKAKHDHLILRTERATLVFNDSRMFGKITMYACTGYPSWWSELPPEILSKNFNYERFSNFLGRRRKSVVKAFLLHQDAFPGVGNWMADEILWRARIDPRRRIETLSSAEEKRLFEEIRFVSRGAMETVGVDFSDPPRTWLFHRRWKDGCECPQTGENLARETVGGRTTCWSPAWQK